MICETKLTIYGYFFVGRNSLQQPKQRLWDSITPACAGKSAVGQGMIHIMDNYPRLRGEKWHLSGLPSGWLGSPPLARGKVYNIRPVYRWARITPACAGKRSILSFFWQPSRDHPRLRGEKPLARLISRKVIGSPPLARGKAIMDFLQDCNLRITPACAGKRPSMVTTLPRSRDHPRLRGEKFCN